MNSGCGCRDCQNYQKRTDRVKDLVEFLTGTQVPDNSQVSIDGDDLVIFYAANSILRYKLPVWEGLPK